MVLMLSEEKFKILKKWKEPQRPVDHCQKFNINILGVSEAD